MRPPISPPTVALLIGLFVQEGACEGDCLSLPDNVHLELGCALHLAKIRLVHVRVDLGLLFRVHGVVYIERDCDLLLVVLFCEFHLRAGRLHQESFDIARDLLALPSLPLGRNLLGQELDQFTFS